MKIHALEDRGARRDFVDLFFLAKEFSLEEMLEFYNQKYGTLESHLYSIARSLSYFKDAEMDDMPDMLIPVSWEAIRTFFKNQSIALAKRKLKI